MPLTPQNIGYGLTAGEIQAEILKAKDAIREERAQDLKQVCVDFEAQLNAWRSEVRSSLDVLRDGAQSQLILHAMLAGDPQLGIRGFIQQTEEHFNALDDKVDKSISLQRRRHRQNLARFKTLTNGQSIMTKLLEFLKGTDDKGKPRIVAIGAAVLSAPAIAVYLAVGHHFQSIWHWIFDLKGRR